jgi:hypothetical protein
MCLHWLSKRSLAEVQGFLKWFFDKKFEARAFAINYSRNSNHKDKRQATITDKCSQCKQLMHKKELLVPPFAPPTGRKGRSGRCGEKRTRRLAKMRLGLKKKKKEEEGRSFSTQTYKQKWTKWSEQHQRQYYGVRYTPTKWVQRVSIWRSNVKRV